MNCASVRNIMDLYWEDRLTTARTAESESHLKKCPGCSAEARSQRSLREARRPAPGNLKEKLKDILASQEISSRPAPASVAWKPDREAVAVLAGAALCASLTVLLNWIGPGVPSQQYAPPDIVTGRIP